MQARCPYSTVLADSRFTNLYLQMDYFHKAGLLVAGPTTGKSFLVESMGRKGLAVTDTDDIITTVIPEFFRYKLRNESGVYGKFAAKCRDIIVADELLRTHPKWVLTNLWRPEFLQRLFRKASADSTKPLGDIFVFRANALEIVRLSKHRGTALSTRLTNKWSNSAERYAPEWFDRVLWLPKGVFLADVVQPSKGGWILTRLGDDLSKLSRTQALDFVIADWKGGNDE
jgi:hypothetical protein